VDFLDLGIGDARWPTFNVADIAVSCGALALAWVLRETSDADAAPASARIEDRS
jgi:signal peptidase II